MANLDEMIAAMIREGYADISQHADGMEKTKVLGTDVLNDWI